MDDLAEIFSGARRLIEFYDALSLQAGNVEVTWVISDFVGNAAANELSVTKGQQVEVLEMSVTTPDYCLVRVTAGGTSSSASASAAGGSSGKSSGSGGAAANVNQQPQLEGLVPMAILKPSPTFSKTSPRRTLDLENAGMLWDGC